jgi:hypothetical protein
MLPPLNRPPAEDRFTGAPVGCDSIVRADHHAHDAADTTAPVEKHAAGGMVERQRHKPYLASAAVIPVGSAPMMR